MSRTHNTDPHTVRVYRSKGERAPRNWRERQRFWLSHAKRINEEYDPVEDDKGVVPYSWDGVGEIAKEQNRLYRVKSRQAIREERFDDICPPATNAKWLST